MSNDIPGSRNGRLSAPLPEDDKGINLDKMLQVCDAAIDRAWTIVVQNQKSKNMTISQLSQVLDVINKAFVISSNIQKQNVDQYVYDNYSDPEYFQSDEDQDEDEQEDIKDEQ